jgi:uncharacterized protein YqeY
MALAAVKLAEVERRAPLDEPALLAILQKEVKTRQEEIAQAKRAGRDDLVSAAEAELDVLLAYLPRPLTPEELEGLARQAIAETGASGPQDMGRVMKTLMPRVQTRADGRAVSDLVRTLLSCG